MWLVLTAGAAQAAPLAIQPPDLVTTATVAPRYDGDPTFPPGRCLIRVVVGADGAPTEVGASSCPPKYAALAEGAVRQWRWAPPSSAPAATVVAVEFTPRGRLAVAPASTCAYTVRVASDGRVQLDEPAAPQCAFWPVARVPGPLPAGRCTVAIDGGIQRDTPGWVVAEDCDDVTAEFAQVIAGASLFVEGTEATRITLKLPAASSAPSAADLDLTGKRVTAAPAGGRISGPSGGTDALDPTLAVPEDTTAPTVDLTDLGALVRARPPAPKPAPDEDDAEEDPPER
ncbi:MAG: hypothetical protein R3F59_09760 [Myxococcota bacterium]